MLMASLSWKTGTLKGGGMSSFSKILHTNGFNDHVLNEYLQIGFLQHFVSDDRPTSQKEFDTTYGTRRVRRS